VPMISAVPSSDDMLGVHALSIGSPGKAHIRRPLERRSKVLALARVRSRGRSSSQPWKPTPPSPQRWPLRQRHPTVTAGQAGNDVKPETSVAVDPLSMPRWVGRARARTRGGTRTGCGSAVTGIRARKAQSGQGAADPCDAPNGQE
jgi:hypothetical protein